MAAYFCKNAKSFSFLDKNEIRVPGGLRRKKFLRENILVATKRQKVPKIHKNTMLK